MIDKPKMRAVLGHFFHRLKALIPFAWLQPYHYLLARLAAWWYGYPSRSLVVIGVTGTNGKTTTAYLTAKALEASGFQTGCTTTAMIKVGEKEWLNRSKMTMPGRFFIQRLMRDMVRAGCRYAVIETSSQGLRQFRHLGVAYDVAVLTNLTPEHIEAHGGWEAYKQAKATLFRALAVAPVKRVAGRVVPKVVIVNAQSEHADFFRRAATGVQALTYRADEGEADIAARDVHYQDWSTTCRVAGAEVKLHIPGQHNLENALAALAVCKAVGVDLTLASERLGRILSMPGRLERVDLGQPWTVVIDYAYEPEALRRCLEAVHRIPHQRLIHVLGGRGGGRDASRRPLMGAMAARQADVVIVTNEDPYDDDPQAIIDQVAEGARVEGQALKRQVLAIMDRQEAIAEAMQLARAGDMVLLTGKGCEPWICVADGKKIPWNERAAAEEGIRRVWYNTTHA